MSVAHKLVTMGLFLSSIVGCVKKEQASQELSPKEKLRSEVVDGYNMKPDYIKGHDRTSEPGILNLIKYAAVSGVEKDDHHPDNISRRDLREIYQSLGEDQVELLSSVLDASPPNTSVTFRKLDQDENFRSPYFLSVNQPYQKDEHGTWNGGKEIFSVTYAEQPFDAAECRGSEAAKVSIGGVEQDNVEVAMKQLKDKYVKPAPQAAHSTKASVSSPKM